VLLVWGGLRSGGGGGEEEEEEGAGEGEGEGAIRERGRIRIGAQLCEAISAPAGPAAGPAAQWA
jgi:hypothetical protein